MDWLLHQQLDRMRRAQGRLLDTVGPGPAETPNREIHREAGVTLRRYGGGEETGPLVLIVPAPIKRPYIWDLAPEVSAVLEYAGDVGVSLRHVGPLVGRNAHAQLWPQIVDWIARTWAH